MYIEATEAKHSGYYATRKADKQGYKYPIVIHIDVKTSRATFDNGEQILLSMIPVKVFLLPR